MQFLSEALHLLGGSHRLRTVRADSGFYADNFLQFLEERALPYIVVARLTTYLKSRPHQVTEWQDLDAIYSVSEFRFKLSNWKTQRRFVVVRELIQAKKPAVGRQLIDLPGYVFRVFVTNRSDAALETGAITTVELPWSAALMNSRTNWLPIISVCDRFSPPSRRSWLCFLVSIS